MCVCVLIEREVGGGRKRELYPFPDPSAPKYIYQYSKLSVFVFSDLWSDYLVWFVLFCFFFCGCITNQSRQKSVIGQFFYHISFKNSVRTHIFNKTDALQNWCTMTLGRLYFVYVCKCRSGWKTLGRLYFGYFTTAKVRSASAKVVLDKRPYKISSKAMHRVCCFRWWRHVISRTADVWSELVSLVSSILPPLPRFRAVICYWPLCLQTRHMWRWLTSVKLRMQNRCSLV